MSRDDEGEHYKGWVRLLQMRQFFSLCGEKLGLTRWTPFEDVSGEMLREDAWGRPLGNLQEAASMNRFERRFSQKMLAADEGVIRMVELRNWWSRWRFQAVSWWCGNRFRCETWSRWSATILNMPYHGCHVMDAMLVGNHCCSWPSTSRINDDFSIYSRMLLVGADLVCTAFGLVGTDLLCGISLVPTCCICRFCRLFHGPPATESHRRTRSICRN